MGKTDKHPRGISITVISAAVPATTISFIDHNGGTRTWSHLVKPGAGTWTNYLLTSSQNGALEAASSLDNVKRLNSVARFSVSTVTGANGYFCVNEERIDDYGLREWAIPLLARSRHAEGLIFTKKEHRQTAEDGLAAWLLSFSADKPTPESRRKVRGFLAMGIAQGIDQRFKCRVRKPWYRVPVVPAGSLLLSKRSNRYPRVICNHAEVVTTDTIYRGHIIPGAPVTPEALTATFHNSLTMLSAEVEGRSFGGGVLELVPSEVNSLLVPVVPTAEPELSRLDNIVRTSNDPEALITATDEMISRLLPALDRATLDGLSDARHDLMSRRLQRAYSKSSG